MKKVIAILLLVILSFATLSLAACNKWEPMPADQTTITVAATPTPHAEILEQAKPLLAELGYTLVIKVYTDYVQPNDTTEFGDVDANYFQHLPYMDEFNQTHETHLVSVGAIHYESFAIYKGTRTSLDQLQNGDIVLIPNDGTNRARALLLLQEAGLITLKDGVGLNATKYDIVANPKNLEVKEMEAQNIPKVRQDAAIAVINGNYALDNNLTRNDAILYERTDGIAATTYANILCVRDGNQNHPAIQALLQVLRSETIINYINNTYGGVVIPTR